MLKRIIFFALFFIFIKTTHSIFCIICAHHNNCTHLPHTIPDCTTQHALDNSKPCIEFLDRRRPDKNPDHNSLVINPVTVNCGYFSHKCFVKISQNVHYRGCVNPVDYAISEGSFDENSKYYFFYKTCNTSNCNNNNRNDDNTSTIPPPPTLTTKNNNNNKKITTLSNKSPHHHQLVGKTTTSPYSNNSKNNHHQHYFYYLTLFVFFIL